MRTVPTDLTIEPMPGGFDPPIADSGTVLKWIGTIAGGRYMLGLRPDRSTGALAKAYNDLRFGVWQLQEFARLGRLDLMRYASEGRHPPKGQRTRPTT